MFFLYFILPSPPPALFPASPIILSSKQQQISTASPALALKNKKQQISTPPPHTHTQKNKKKKRERISSVCASAQPD